MVDRGNDMGEERLAKIGPLLSAIGEEAALVVSGDPNGIYIFAEVWDGSTFASIYHDEGESIRYYDPGQRLFRALRDAWDAEDPDKRWTVMEYEIRGEAFDVSFLFPDEVDEDDHASSRREVALEKRYGSRPIIYPPIPDHFLNDL